MTDTTSMNTKELYAHYKQTAPFEDLAFFMCHMNAPELQADCETLRATAFKANGRLSMPRAAFYKALTVLHERWRRASNERERQERAAA